MTLSNSTSQYITVSVLTARAVSIVLDEDDGAEGAEGAEEEEEEEDEGAESGDRSCDTPN
jgi:hypothetical protein